MENQGYTNYYQPYAPRPTVDLEKLQRSRERKNLMRIGLGMLTYLLVTSLVQSAAIFVAERLFPAFYEGDYFMPAISLLSYAIGIPIFFGFVAGMDKQTPERKKLGFAGWIGFLAVSFVMVNIGSQIASVLMAAMESIRGESISNAIADQIGNSSALSNLILVVILAPIVEELICRKLIIDRLLPYGEVLAVVTSGLFFGLIHGNFYQFFYAALMGLLLGLVYVKTGKLIHTILMHAIINFTGSIIASFVGEKMPEDLSVLDAPFDPWLPVVLLYYLAYMALIVCGVIFLIRGLRKIHLAKEGPKGMKLSSQFKVAWLNVGTLILLGFCALMFAASLFI